MTISSDQIELCRWGPIVLNWTIAGTWIVMLVLTVGALWITRRLTTELHASRGQQLLETLVLGIQGQIREITQQDKQDYLPFIATLFLLIAMSVLLSLIPGFMPPTASLSTTAALATCVFVAVPAYGLRQQGLRAYFKQYIEPSVFMLPLNIIGELSRTLALAVRLYGNMLSGTVIGAILLTFVPLFVPVVMQMFGLLTGMIQAYIFAVLALVFIASATQAHEA